MGESGSHKRLKQRAVVLVEEKGGVGGIMEGKRGADLCMSRKRRRRVMGERG